MKAENIQIFRLEDRILFEAAAAAEIVDAADAAAAVQNDPNANVSESERHAQEAQNALKNAPAENPAENINTPIADPDVLTDIDAQLDAIIEGTIPAANDVDGDDAEAFFADNGTTVTVGKELAVINGNLKDIDSILAQIDKNFDVLILQDNNGLDEVNEFLDAQDSNYSAIHFIVHGYKDEMTINGEVIDNDSFDSADWKAVGQHLTSDGDILLYGCHSAATENGVALVDRIAEASGADVAASDDMTGLSGDWELEYTNGEINTAAISCDAYDYNLAATEISVDTIDDLNDALSDAAIYGGDVKLTIENDITVEDNIYMDCEYDLELSIVGNGDITISADNDTDTMFSITNFFGNQVNIAIENLDFSGNGGNQTAIDAIDVNSISITDSAFTDFGNRAIAYDSADGTLTFTNSIIADNNTFGGAVNAYCKDIIIDSTTFANNTANEGGALYFDAADGGSLTIRNNSQFINNSATVGGAISATNATVSIDKSYFSGNKAEDGGAMQIRHAGDILISNSAFDNNSATDVDPLYDGASRGGAVHIVEAGEVKVINSTFYNNSASIGGALAIAYANSDSGTVIQNSTFYNNTASADGGAIYNGAGSLTVENTLLIANGNEDLHQQTGGNSTLNYVFMTQSVAEGATGITLQNSKTGVTAAEVFGNNTYDQDTHTITLDAFGEAAYSGTLIGTIDQLGNSRTEAQDALGVNKYAIGAVAAPIGLYIKQNDIASQVYNGGNIAVSKNLSLVFADGTTVISSDKYNDLTADIVPVSVRDAGTYTITPENGSVSLNSDAVTLVPLRYLSGTFVIEKADVTVTIDGSKTYDGNTAMGETVFEYTITYTNGGNGFDTGMFEVTDFVYNNKNVHTDLTASGSANLLNNVERNFDVIFEFQSSISQRDLNISAASGNTVYNGTKHTLSGVSADNLVAGDVISTNASISGTNAGTYDYVLDVNSIFVNDADGGNMLGNYNILSFTDGALFIDKADVTVTVDGSKIYDGNTAMGGTAFEYTITYTNGGNGFDTGMFDVTDFVYNNKNVHADLTASGTSVLLNNAEQNFDVTFEYQSSITAKPVEAVFITAEPYEYNKYDQSGTVSAYYIDVNGEKVALPLDWHGQEFTNPGTYTVTVINNDPNYTIENPSITLVITDVKYSNGPYSEGIYPEYSSTVPSMEAQLLIDRVSNNNDWHSGNIYSLTYGQLISNTMLANDRQIVADAPIRVSVDPLVYRPFELDALQKENSELLFANSSVTNEQAFHTGREIFNDAGNDAVLFETRAASYSEEHEPLYIEEEVYSDELETTTVSLRAVPVSLPVDIFRKAEDAVNELADIALPEVAGSSFAAVNFKSELDELLESVAGIS